MSRYRMKYQKKHLMRHHVMFVAVVLLFGIIVGQLQGSTQQILAGFADLSSRILRKDQSWTLLITGDVIPARSVNYQMTKRDNFLWAISDIAQIVKDADLTLINLEAPLIKNCPLTNTGMIFCGDQRFVSALTYAGVDVVNLANNHVLNYGWDGLAQTEELLAQNGIETIGFTTNSECDSGDKFCSKFYQTDIRGTTIGFLGYTIVGVAADQDVIVSQIAHYDRLVDVLIISFHWGAEYTRLPIGAPDDPVKIARLAVDNGADLIVGNHPHWIQGREVYKGKTIFYALGNTIFDQEWSKETKTGIIVKLTFDNADISDTELFPLSIQDYGKATLLTGKEREKALTIFARASSQLQK